MGPLEENGTNGRRIVPCWRKDTFFTLPSARTGVNKTGADTDVIEEGELAASNAESREPNEPVNGASAPMEQSREEETESGENGLNGAARRKYKRTSIEIWGTEKRRHSRRMLERHPAQTCECCMEGNSSRKSSASTAPMTQAPEFLSQGAAYDVLGLEANEFECDFGMEMHVDGITAFGLEEDDPEERSGLRSGSGVGAEIEGGIPFGLEEEELEEGAEPDATGARGIIALGLEEEEPEEDSDLAKKGEGACKHRLPKPQENLTMDARTRVALRNNLSDFAMDFELPSDYFEVA